MEEERARKAAEAEKAAKEGAHKAEVDAKKAAYLLYYVGSRGYSVFEAHDLCTAERIYSHNDRLALRTDRSMSMLTRPSESIRDTKV